MMAASLVSPSPPPLNPSPISPSPAEPAVDVDVYLGDMEGRIEDMLLHASDASSRLQTTVCEQVGNITSQHLTVNATLQQLTRLVTSLLKNDTAALDWLLSASEDTRVLSALAASPCGDGHALNYGALAALAGVVACCGCCCGRRKVRDRARHAVRTGIEMRAEASAARRARVLRHAIQRNEDASRLRPPHRREKRPAYDDLSDEELSPAYLYDDDDDSYDDLYDDDDDESTLVMEPARHHARPLRQYERSSRDYGQRRVRN